MNIYIYLEIAMRELDSKLLLAVIAASRGHAVMISDWKSIEIGLSSGDLKPGIFHTKSITPSPAKLKRHAFLIDKGTKITCIDEESGLMSFDYDKFAKMRFSEDSVAQASALFCWGRRDYEYLSKKYPNQASVFQLTGSPRVDLWKNDLGDYWGMPTKLPKKPYILVSSNLGLTNGKRVFAGFYQSVMGSGYFLRSGEYFDELFGKASEEFILTREYIKTIRFFCSNNSDIEVVFRPHPNENPDIWKLYFSGVRNCHVVCNDSIGAWINNAVAIVHNGCTTALESSVAGVPVLTFLPFKQTYENEVPNQIGLKVHDGPSLLSAVNQLVSEKTEGIAAKTAGLGRLSELISVSDQELSAVKIVDVWESLSDSSFSQESNWSSLQSKLSKLQLKKKLIAVLAKIFPSKYSVEPINHKFPPFDEQDICRRVERLQKVLGITEPLECKLLAERFVRITKKTNLHG